MQVLEFDTVVIGSGLAGLTTALHASRFGKVAIITKSGLDISNSYNAQGGIAAAIGEDDTTDLHKYDSKKAGRGLCDEDAIEILVSEGKNCVEDIIDIGMPFDKIGDEIILGLEGGHSKRRILHAGGDQTGKILTRFMYHRTLEAGNIEAFENTIVFDLLVENTVCKGATALDFKTQKNILFKSKAVVIATGGLARIYSRTTNPHTATGDGYALGFKAGAQLSDMEFIQFHPTALHIEDKDAFLISEAVRGEGAHLINEKGERFMLDQHELAELAPRDVVSFAIFKEIQNSLTNHVFLSLKHLDSDKIKNRFKQIYTKLQEFGLDLTKDNIPVAPAAHYTIGGIKTDLNGQTNIKNLFAAGEVASTGVMGANRIASNSLLECLVYGKRAGISAGKVNQVSDIDLVETNFKLDVENETVFLENKNKIASIMNNYVGIVRSKESLNFALEEIRKIRDRFLGCDDQYNLCKIKSNAEICLQIAQAALEREESRGSHIREDFRDENVEFMMHSVQEKNKDIHFESIRK
ncbi:MAG: L-aspartate oxidase [Draconibacterium sp.]|nr:L-aspartate oxidase [Draconibacterium sp.]